MIKALAFIFLFTTISIVSNAQDAYIKKYKPLSDSLSNVYKIPSSVILAVAIVESASGKSFVAKQLNNHFGIVGKNSLYKRKKIRSRYKQYPSVYLSYVDFCHVIAAKKFYVTLQWNKDPEAWVDAISKTGYAAKPDVWKKGIMQMIEKYRLYVAGS